MGGGGGGAGTPHTNDGASAFGKKEGQTSRHKMECVESKGRGRRRERPDHSSSSKNRGSVLDPADDSALPPVGLMDGKPNSAFPLSVMCRIKTL